MGPLCRVCGTEHPEEAFASGPNASAIEALAAEIDRDTPAAADAAELAELKESFAAMTARAEAAEAHAAELEQLLTEPPAAPPPVDPPAKADKAEPKAKSSKS